jgi:hypothetical protein
MCGSVNPARIKRVGRGTQAVHPGMTAHKMFGFHECVAAEHRMRSRGAQAWAQFVQHHPIQFAGASGTRS